jgi:hypothetical protein
MELWIGTNQNSILFATKDWIICPYPKLHTFRYKRLNYLSLSKPPYFSLQKTELFVAKNMELWIGTNNSVFCSGYNVSTLCQNLQKRYKQVPFPMWITILRQKIIFFPIAEGGAKILGVFRVKNHDFTLAQNNPYLFNFNYQF